MNAPSLSRGGRAESLVVVVFIVAICTVTLAPFGLVAAPVSAGGASTSSPPLVSSPATTSISSDPALGAGGITPVSPSIDDGQSITLTSNSSGGTTPYNYQWYESNSNSGVCYSGSPVGTNSPTYGTGALASGSPYYYCYNVTDAEPANMSSSWDQVTVNSALVSGAPSPASPSIDYGQSIKLTANPSGGTLPYGYQWYWSSSNSGACSLGAALGTSSTLVTGAEITGSGAYYYCYVVTDNSQADGGPESGSSGWNLVTVNSALGIPTISPSNPTIDDGQKVTFTSGWLGGAPEFSAELYSGSSPTCNADTSVVQLLPSLATGSASFTAVSPGTNTYYCIVVTDASTGAPAASSTSAVSLVTVNSAFSSGSVTPSSPSIDTGQSVTLTANPVGGTPSYSYQWYSSSTKTGACNGGTALETSRTQSVSPTASRYYCVSVTDSSSVTVASAKDAVTVNTALTSPGAPTVSATALDANQPLTATGAIPSTGTPTYSWQWLISVDGGAYAVATLCVVASGTGAVGGAPKTCSIGAGMLTAGDTYSFELKVSDNSSTPETKTSAASSTVSVSAELTAGAPTPTTPTIDSGQSVTLTANPSGGTTPYSYQWYSGSTAGKCTGLGSPISGEKSSTYSASPTTTTYYCYELKDTASDTAVSKADQVEVNSALTAPGAPTPNATLLDAAQPLTVTGTIPSTGTPTYSWQWLISTNGGAYADATQCGTSASGSGAAKGATETCTIPGGTLAASASYTFELRVTDAASTPETKTSSASSAVTTSSALTAGTPTPASLTLDAGQFTTLMSNPSGGTTPYSYQWYSSSAGTGACDSGNVLGTSETQLVSPTMSTYYCYVVTDSAHSPVSQSSGWDQVTVNPALTAPDAPTPSATALDVDQGLSVTGGIPSTGTSSYEWQWLVSVSGSAYADSTQCSMNDGTGAVASATETCSIAGGTLAVGDTYAFELQVTDNASTPETSASSASSAVMVDSALTAPAAPTPSDTTLDVSQPLTVTGVIPSTGAPTYSWHWLISINSGGYAAATQCAVSSGSGASASATETCSIAAGTLTAADTYTFELMVTDSATAPETQTSMASATINTTSALSAGSPTPTTATIDSGQSVTLTANPSGGAGSYTYQWYSGNTASGCTGLGSPISGATSSTYTASPTTTTYYCYVVTEDSKADAGPGFASSPAVLVTVNPALVAPSIPTTNATTLDVDQALTVTGAVPTTGTPTYSWQWLVSVDGGAYVDATQCAVSSGTGASGGATVTCSISANTLTAGDTYSFELKVTDSATTPFTQTSTATSVVTATSSGPAPSASSSSFWVYVGIALTAIAAVILIVSLFALRRRRPHDAAVSPIQPWEEGPTPPSDRGLTTAAPVHLEAPEYLLNAPLEVPAAPVEPSAVLAAVPPFPPGEAKTDVDSVLAELDRISAEMSKRPPKKTAEANPENETDDNSGQ